MELSPASLWFIAGLALLIAEALGIPGVGLMFAGLGAIAAGIALYAGFVADGAHVAQFLIFFVATALCAWALWKPMQKFHAGKNGYNNMIGETAYVGSGGLGSEPGEVTWSGTIMKAELVDGAPKTRLEAGAPVVIVEVRGAKLIVRPKA